MKYREFDNMEDVEEVPSEVQDMAHEVTRMVHDWNEDAIVVTTVFWPVSVRGKKALANNAYGNSKRLAKTIAEAVRGETEGRLAYQEERELPLHRRED